MASWRDTTGESPIYPVGDAQQVYRAVLDLLYLDGDKRPPIIVMHDTAEGRTGGPSCPFDKCVGAAWPHKSKMDPATVLTFARLSPKRPAVREFGYPIPMVFLSTDDVQRMEADGQAILARRPKQQYQTFRGFWVEFQRKYPAAWGVTFLSKVGFNPRHTEALVGARQWCGDECRSDETLFLRQTAGRWRVVERIPNEAEPAQSLGILQSPGNLRYIGPVGTNPKESEIIPVGGRSSASFEANARSAVYRAVLDSLYTFLGERPKTVVLTDGFRLAPIPLPPHASAIDSGLIRRYAFLSTVRAPFDARPKYRIPIAILPLDSLPVLKERGVPLDVVPQTGSPFWLAFTKRYPGAWGMVGLSRIAFNPARTQALVYTNHACGDNCLNLDTWYLERTGSQWRIAERIPVEAQPNVELDRLRYLGVDAKPDAYRPRRVQGVVTDETQRPVPSLEIRINRMLPSGAHVTDPSVRTDSAGHFALTNLPLMNAFTLAVGCPGKPSHEAILFVPLVVRPGIDSTMNLAIDLRQCVDPPAP